MNNTYKFHLRLVKDGEKITRNFTDFDGYPNLIRTKTGKKYEVLHKISRENRFVGTVQLTKMVGQYKQVMLNDRPGLSIARVVYRTVYDILYIAGNLW